jgi:hypothetical protein
MYFFLNLNFFNLFLGVGPSLDLFFGLIFFFFGRMYGVF